MDRTQLSRENISENKRGFCVDKATKGCYFPEETNRLWAYDAMTGGFER